MTSLEKKRKLKHWSKNCQKYNACDERVYFVRDNLYNREYVPRYQKQHRDRRDDRRDERGEDRHGKQDRHDNGQGRGRDR